MKSDKWMIRKVNTNIVLDITYSMLENSFLPAELLFLYTSNPHSSCTYCLQRENIVCHGNLAMFTRCASCVMFVCYQTGLKPFYNPNVSYNLIKTKFNFVVFKLPSVSLNFNL